MMFILNPGVNEAQVREFRDEFEKLGFQTIYCPGTQMTAIGLIGNTSSLDPHNIVETHNIIRSGTRVSEPYKLVNRSFHAENKNVEIGNVIFGEGHFQVISGPCSVESEEQIIEVAKAVKKSGATILRGGAYKPRSSPYSFQGLQEDGLKLLSIAKKETGLPIITEMTNIRQLENFDDVDIIQIGARNMQNFDLLKEVGHCRKPVLLKRGLNNTIEEFLMSAEYIMAGGNENIILCERGIRTIETMTRNTLDVSAVPLLKKESYLPVIIDPSHASGIRSLVPPLSKAAVAVGVDGLMIETHNDPAQALCDGAQSLDLLQFDSLMQDIKRRVEFEGKIFG
ncbi:3-deoxy-7-phosphoheptulonate synthase [Parasporobacterium paucivorans]|uniref:3-deoxy-D-arabinoheptulosonate-7-phosphate synthase n=1 Tax=Parasporobacterium paucivorans DSM 15970 TaxID=1122934 RepID=A0A1M6IGF9_9FIRM|nr:3-deoxy-7-phosphoheptulonate synthase [Parasporobacterium paucivorans]SHJ33499.1 3-deoxy-D-arabinoheptulosonate-7-phosphate synthase [Parasporobacterium paucivorans DSM 15970]